MQQPIPRLRYRVPAGRAIPFTRKNNLVRSLVLLCFLLTPISLPAFASSAKPKGQAESKKAAASVQTKGDPVAGKLKSESERCQECHGSEGQGLEHSNGTEAKFAKLAGQYADYMVKQIRDFRSGIRKDGTMAIMANSIDDADLHDIAAYFASRKKMQGSAGNDTELGRKLFNHGDAARNIVSCSSCHGADGKGIGALNASVPVIGGQEWRYLEKQLLDWRSGDRHNSADGTMNRTTKALTDIEIRSLADYLSGL
ncbi:MAG: c-type cytochrome [Burkholderiaceae bacterium]